MPDFGQGMAMNQENNMEDFMSILQNIPLWIINLY